MENWRKIGASLVCVLVFGCYERTQWDLGTRLSGILCFEANFVMLYCDNMTNGKSQTMVDCLASTAVIGGEVSCDRMRLSFPAFGASRRCKHFLSQLDIMSNAVHYL